MSHDSCMLVYWIPQAAMLMSIMLILVNHMESIIAMCLFIYELTFLLYRMITYICLCWVYDSVSTKGDVKYTSIQYINIMCSKLFLRVDVVVTINYTSYDTD